MQNNNNGVTLDDLAGMIKSGFDDVDKCFEQVDKRFTGIENRLDGIDLRLDGIDERLGRIENLILTDHRHRLEYLELELHRMKDMFAFK